MEEEKCSHLSQIDEELNFTLSKLQSMEIKESIRIVDSNILPPLKNSLEIKVPTSNFKKNLEKEIIEKELEQKPDPSISNIHTPSMLIINDKNNKAIAAEKSLSISPQKEASRIMNEKLMKEEPKSLGKYLNIVTKNRKQVNSEAQVLANRIALLKQEELKTLKKIKETKNKADEIYRLKKQNYERSIERAAQLKLTRDLINNKIMDKKKFREHTKEEKYQFRDTFHTFKFQEMTSVKKESQKNQLRKTSYEKKVLENNLAKANFIKKQLLIGNLKVEEYKTNKLLKVKREYEHKINDEKSLTKKSEFDIIEMEKMELELIRNLQQSQYLQKTVYEELEGALTLPLIDFENKYKMKNNTEENEKKMTKKRKKKKTVGDFNQLKVKINNFKF